MKILKKIYTFWCGFNFIIWMLLALPFTIIPYLFGEKIGGAIAFSAIKSWAYLFSKFSFIRYVTINKKIIPRNKAFIYACNHGSYLDSPGLLMAIPGQIRALGKVELKKIPILGYIIAKNSVLVDRSSPESRKRSILKLKNRLDRQISIFIFPEGHMNRTEKPLTDFYDGAFKIAIDTQTPIIPMVIINARELMPRKGKVEITPGQITIIFSEPIETKGMASSDFKGLKEKVYKIMEDMIVENSPIYSKTDYRKPVAVDNSQGQ